MVIQLQGGGHAMTDEQRLRTILREELNAWGQRIGLDTADPLSQQADFRHLRRWRHVMERTGLRAIYTVVTLGITGTVAAIWATLSSLHR